MYRRLLLPAATLAIVAALIHPPHPQTMQTAQIEPRPTERPATLETKPEVRQISVSRNKDRKPVAVKQAIKKKPNKSQPKPVVNYAWSAGEWSRFPAWIEQSARCIAKHESWNQGLWKAINPNTRISTASGFAQWTNPTWKTQTQRAGIGTQYSRAVYAPPRVQAAVFAYQARHHGLYPWNGTHCPGT